MYEPCLMQHGARIGLSMFVNIWLARTVLSKCGPLGELVSKLTLDQMPLGL